MVIVFVLFRFFGGIGLFVLKLMINGLIFFILNVYVFCEWWFCVVVLKLNSFYFLFISFYGNELYELYKVYIVYIRG